MKKNTILDMNDILMAQLEKLSDDDIKGQQLDEEVQRSKAMALISKNIIDNAKLALDVCKYRENYGDEDIPTILIGNDQTREPSLRKALGL